MDKEAQVEEIRKTLKNCKTVEQQRSAGIGFIMNMSYSRGAICRVLKELGINDNFTIKGGIDDSGIGNKIG